MPKGCLSEEERCILAEVIAHGSPQGSNPVSQEKIQRLRQHMANCKECRKAVQETVAAIQQGRL